MFDDSLDWIPENLEAMPPGYVLAAVLDDIDIDTCDGYDRIRVLRAHQRMASHYQARTYHTMTTVVDAMADDAGGEDFAEEAAAIEVATALRLTRRAADIEMRFAIDLQRRLPQVWEALCDGHIDVRRAKVIVNATLHLLMAGARDVAASIVPDAGLLTTGQLREKLRKLCIDINPEDAADRYDHAVEDRRVVSEPTDAGTSNLFGIDLPPHRVAACLKRINQLARGLRGPNETRTMDQLRADVLLDLLEGTGQATRAGRGMVDLHSDLKTLAELTDHPGELAGYGPVVADIARQVAEQQHKSKWRWTIDDPDTGLPVFGGTTRRRPTSRQRRFVEARNRTCVHPGCRMPSVDCDIDHRIPWAESRATNTADLAPMCRFHHVARHRHGWSYEPLGNGDHKLTSPLGHTYTTSGRSP
ncbi:MAG: DUF222 domain-containing protein [bacterium]|nr:DUF222 domain-containing protein [bacterium]